MRSVRLLIDTTVLLDVVLGREAFLADALALFAGAEAGAFHGFIGATSVTTAHYFARKALGSGPGLEVVRRLTTLFEVAPVTAAVIGDALAAPLGDFEDAVLAHAAVRAGARGIVTRDAAGFAGAPLPVYSPAEALAVVRSR